MSRMSVAALTTLPDEAGYLEKMDEAAKFNQLAFTGTRGTYQEILDVVASWVILPEVIIFDVPEDKDAFDALSDLAERVPKGSGDVVLTGVPNDIKTYRKMKSMGVSEIFPSEQGEDELKSVLEEIANRELRSTEIDPRRAVYVWSASGGAGGTSVALAFAKYLSKEGRRTLFIDLDLYSAPASYMYAGKEGARETYGLVESLITPGRIDAVFLERAIQKVDKNLFYLSSRKKSSDTDFDATALSTLVSRAQNNFDVVVVDTPWRGEPVTDWGKVNGVSFVVAAPTATSYLGFTTIVKELASTSSKSPIFGIINKSGEFKSNDFTRKMFAEAIDNEVFELPYDPAATGKMFFAQRTMAEVGGRIARPLNRIMKNLPDKVALANERKRIEPGNDSSTDSGVGFLASIFRGKGR
jgi:Mrp family chromosome partitioning ATPase